MYWCSFLKNQQWSKDYDEGLSDAGNDKGYERKVRPLYILMKTVRIGHWSVTIWNQPLRARALLRPKCWKTKCLRRKQGFTYRPNFLANWDWKTRIFWKFSLRSKRFRASSWRMLGWEQKREMNWTFISFALTPTFVRLLERKLDNIHLHRSVIFTQRLCHGHADDLFPIFFLLQKRLCHSLPRRRFPSREWRSMYPSTPNPSPLRNEITLLFHFVAVKNILIFKSSMLVF